MLYIETADNEFVNAADVARIETRGNDIVAHMRTGQSVPVAIDLTASQHIVLTKAIRAGLAHGTGLVSVDDYIKSPLAAAA